MYRPSIIWSLHEQSDAYVEHWFKGLSEEAKTKYVKLAVHDWEQVRDGLRHYNRKDVADQLKEIGIGDRFEGTSVILVAVAYGMGKEAFNGWDKIEDLIRSLQNEVAHIEFHRILLARYQRHQLQEREIKCKGIKRTPWLISDRTSRRQELDDTAFQRLLNRLLDVLCLTGRRRDLSAPDPVGKFFENLAQPNSVKLLGTPEIDIDELAMRIARDCAMAYAGRRVAAAKASTKPEFIPIRDVERVIREVRNGELDADDYSRRLIGRQGFAGLEASELIVHGPDLVKKLIERIEATARVLESCSVSDDPDEKPGCLLWPLAGLIFRGRMKVQSDDQSFTTDPRTTNLKDEMEAVVSVLKQMEDCLSQIGERLTELDVSSVEIPELYKRQLRNALEKMTRAILADVRDDTVTYERNEQHLQRYLTALYREGQGNLLKHMINGTWSNSHPETVKLHRMNSDTFYTYSACVRRGLSINGYAGVIGDDMPQLDDRMFGRVGVREAMMVPVLLASSPLPVEHLDW